MVASGAINDSEVVSGLVVKSIKGVYTSFAVTWDRTNGLREIGSVYKDKGSTAVGINSSGLVIGVGYNKHQEEEGFVWSEESGMTLLGDLPGGEYWCTPRDINDSGSIAGDSGIGDNGVSANQIFIWDKENGMRACGSLAPGRNSVAHAINNANVIVGWSEPEGEAVPIIWDEENGMRRYPPNTDDFIAGYGRDINNLGQITAIGQTKDGVLSAYLWDPDDGYTLFRLPGKPTEWSAGNYLNDNGVVIGEARRGHFDSAYWIWDRDHGIRDINTILAASTPEENRPIWSLDGLNNRNQLIGHIECRSCRGVLLSPVSLGDANCDGLVDFDDVGPFVTTLIEPPAPADDTGLCAPFAAADVNEDAAVDFDDIEPFVWCCLLKACD